MRFAVDARILARHSRRCARWYPGRTRSRRRSDEHLHLAGTPARSFEDVRTNSRWRWYLLVVNGGCHCPIPLVTSCLRMRLAFHSDLRLEELSQSSLGPRTPCDSHLELAEVARGSLEVSTAWDSHHFPEEMVVQRNHRVGTKPGNHRYVEEELGCCTGRSCILVSLEAASLEASYEASQGGRYPMTGMYPAQARHNHCGARILDLAPSRLVDACADGLHGNAEDRWHGLQDPWMRSPDRAAGLAWCVELSSS
jgi:hypothetical protein